MSLRRLDKLGRQFDTLSTKMSPSSARRSRCSSNSGSTMTPPLSGARNAARRNQGAERFEGFMQTLGKRLASRGDRFLKELSRMDSLHDLSHNGQSEADGNQL
jgi:hypothetical protein